MSTQESEQDQPSPGAVRVSGQRRSDDDHPALRKVARAVIAMALRGVQPPASEPVNPLEPNAEPVGIATDKAGHHHD